MILSGLLGHLLLVYLIQPGSVLFAERLFLPEWKHARTFGSICVEVRHVIDHEVYIRAQMLKE